MISYLWNSASHLEVFSLAFESIAGVVELALAICFTRTVFALRNEPTEEIKRQKDRLEAALGLVAGIFFIVAIAACWRIMILSQNERIEAQGQFNSMSNRWQQVESKFNEASNDLAIAKQAAAEAQGAAKTATEAAKPKSPKERLVACLNSMSPQILSALKGGQTKFRVSGVLSKQFEELQTLAQEPGGSSCIRVGHVGTEMFGKGFTYEVNFELSPDLLK